MSASATMQIPLVSLRTREILRYAFGSAFIVCVAYAVSWPLAYLTPVLALMFLGKPTPPPTLKMGISFVAVVAFTCLIGLLIARFLLPYPLIYIPMMGLILLHIFYATPKQLNPFVKIFLLLAIGVIPILGLTHMALASVFAYGLTINVVMTLILVWFVYGVIPFKQMATPSMLTKRPPATVPTSSGRLQNAMISTIVVFPVVMLFTFFEMTSSILILIYVMLLPAQPGFAKDFKAGSLMLLANVAGGFVAIMMYELLVMVPHFVFLLLLVAVTGLIFGKQLNSGKPAAALYGTAFSTVLVIIGMTTNSDAEASTKAYTRIFQTMIAVVYVVTASGFVTALFNSFRKRGDAS